ncbi:MAG: MFS transporter [Polyangiales bacterium]
MSAGFLGLPRIYWILWVGQFINRLGGFVLTFLPVYLTERLHYTDGAAGLVLSLFGAGSLVGATLGGSFGDHFGRRRTILGFGLANATVLLAFGAAPSGPWIAVAAFLHGVTNGYGPALSAAVSDVVAPSDRTRAFGYFYWAVNLGFTFAAALGGALSARGFHWLFVGDALTTLVFCGLVYLRVPETRPAEASAPTARPSTATALRDPRFVPFALSQFVMLTVFLQAFTSMTLEERARGVGVREVGLIAALNGVVIVTAQPVFLRLTRGRPLWTLLVGAGALVMLGAMLASVAQGAAGFAWAMAAFSLGEVAFASASPSYVSHVAPTAQRSSYQSAYSLCWAGASLLAPVVGPSARQHLGAAAMWCGAAALAAVSVAGHAVFTRRAEAA